MRKQRILTGLKPTGTVHLGNYFGAIRQMVDLQEEGELFLFVADLHALTDLSDDGKRHDRETFEETCREHIRAYIALGIDPKKVTVYRQSEFPQITELMWIFICLLKFPFLTIGHAYKDALQHSREPGLGIFLYPALMASDILLPDADCVPVGKDQVQHIEIAREIARKFNAVTGTDYFTEPQERVLRETTIIPGMDGEKMSKSKNNTLPIFEHEEVIRKRISGIITDSTPAGHPIQSASCVVCEYLGHILSKEEYGTVANKCAAGTITYRELKELLTEKYLAYFKEARKTHAKLKENRKYVDNILASDRKKVDTLFTERLNDIRKLLGLSVPPKQGLFG